MAKLQPAAAEDLLRQMHPHAAEDDHCPGRKPPFSAVKRSRAPIQKRHAKASYYGKREGRLTAPGRPGPVQNVQFSSSYLG